MCCIMQCMHFPPPATCVVNTPPPPPPLRLRCGHTCAAGFIALNARLNVWRKRVLAPYGLRGRLVEGAAISAITSLLSFVLPLLVACQGCPVGEASCPRRDNSHSGNFVSFGCLPSNSSYNDLATLFFNTQDDAIRSLFSSKTKSEYTVRSGGSEGRWLWLSPVAMDPRHHACEVAT